MQQICIPIQFLTPLHYGGNPFLFYIKKKKKKEENIETLNPF